MYIIEQERGRESIYNSWRKRNMERVTEFQKGELEKEKMSLL